MESARPEARDIDSDIAQVLDAILVASSNKGGGYTCRVKSTDKSRIAGVARRAAKVPVGTAADVKKDVDRERSAIFDKSDLIEDVMQADTSKLKESLELETKRRKEQERECKGLASRVTDLEAGSDLRADRGDKCRTNCKSCVPNFPAHRSCERPNPSESRRGWRARAPKLEIYRLRHCPGPRRATCSFVE